MAQFFGEAWNKLKENKTAQAGVGVVVFLTVRYAWDQLKRKIYKYPPGPSGLPIIGSIIPFGANTRKFFLSIAKQNKFATMFYIGSKPNIVINDLSIIKSISNKPEFSHRPSDDTLFIHQSYLTTDFNTIKTRRFILNQSLISQAQRSNKLYNLIGKNCIENKLFNEINNCIKLNKKWNIREDARFVTFSTIYGN